MALNYASRYPNQAEIDPQFYPYGEAKNVSAEGAEDGFPFEKDYINDQFGFFQKILKESGTIPNGVVDTAASSQYYNALTSIITNTTYADTENLVAGVTTRVDNLDGELSDAQLELTSTIDELGVVSSRAYLGVSDTVDGKADVTGVVFDSQTNGIRFRGDIFELTTSSDSKALSYNATSDEWVFSGKLVIGGDYEVNSEADIRGLDGKDGQSVAALQDWQFLNSNDGWQSFGLTETLTESYLNVVSTSAAGYMFIDGLGVEGAAENLVSLRIRNKNETTNISMDVFYTTASHGWSESYKKTLPAVNLRQGVWETVIFDMRDLTAGVGDWLDNTITGVRIDLVDTIGADLDIDNISIGHYGAATKGVTYTWIKYADDDQGAGLSDSPVGKDYIGLAYNKQYPDESDIPSDYTFSLIKGTDGVDGLQGYTWIAYSDFEDGTDFYQLPNDDTLYIGISVNQLTPDESGSVKGDYIWSKFRGDEGVAGQDGTDGDDGASGAGFYGSLYATIDWTTATASSRFTTLVGRAPVQYDIFTQTRTDGTDSQSRSFKNGSWVSPELLVNGDLIATGTIAGNRFIAGTEISAPLITGAEVIGGKVATASGTATRVELEDDGTYMQWIGTGAKSDANALFYVKKNGTGFIKGEFFQGELLSTVTGVADNAVASLTAVAASYDSAGKPVTINLGSTINVTAAGNVSPEDDVIFKVVLKRNGTTFYSEEMLPVFSRYYTSQDETYIEYRMTDLDIDSVTSTGARVYSMESSVTAPFSLSVSKHKISFSATENKVG